LRATEKHQVAQIIFKKVKEEEVFVLIGDQARIQINKGLQNLLTCHSSSSPLSILLPWSAAFVVASVIFVSVGMKRIVQTPNRNKDVLHPIK